MPKTSQSSAGDREGGSIVQRTSRAQALQYESWARVFEAKRREWIDMDLYQPYEAFASGEPCRACRRPLLGGPPVDRRDATGAIVNADNADFRVEHESCRMGFWNLEGCSVKHCHQCCPPLPLSPTQIETLRAMLSTPPSRGFTWHLNLTCGHAMSMITGDSSSPPTTTRCSACFTTRGVVEAARGILKATSDASADRLTTGSAAKPAYQLLSDEQWSLINRIVHPAGAPRRGRPSADARTVVNAILYRDATGIAWRELPLTLGSWKTAARRYRQLTANGSWDEVLRLLAQSVPGELATNDPTA